MVVTVMVAMLMLVVCVIMERLLTEEHDSVCDGGETLD